MFCCGTHNACGLDNRRHFVSTPLRESPLREKEELHGRRAEGGGGACCGSPVSEGGLLPSRAPEPPPPASPYPSAGLRAWAEMALPQLAALCSVPRAGDMRGPRDFGVSAALEACCQACSACNSHASAPPAELEMHPLVGSSGSVGVSAPGCACAMACLRQCGCQL